MRERLVAALVGTVLVVVVVMAVVRAYAVAGDLERREQATLQRSLAMADVAVHERLDGGGRVTPAFLTALSDDVVAISYQTPEGDSVTGGVPVAASDRQYAASSTLGDGALLTVVRPSADVSRGISEALLPLVLLALGLLVVAGIAGWLLARRLARPFQELADAARGLARGHAHVVVPHYDVAEAEAIGTALREGLARLDGLLEREREFAVSASHELRSPITSLRLQVEGLGLHPGLPDDARTDVDGVLRGIDRLSAAVAEVLDVARLQRSGETATVDAAPLVAEAVRRVTPRRARRRVQQRVADGMLLRVPVDPFTDVVAALVSDCVRHGTGRVLVEAADRTSHVEIVVADEGPRRGVRDGGHAAPTAATWGSLVTAAESFGARLLVADEPHHRFRLLLPLG